MMVVVPPSRPFRQFAARPNGWSDHYGAFHVAAAYCGRGLPEHYEINGLWQHGAYGPWDCHSPEMLACCAPGGAGRITWVARTDEADYLRQHGYPRVRAVGLPMLYTERSGLARQPRSLLVMPGHSLVGWKVPDRAPYERYADEIAKVAKDFERVVVCVSPSCQKNGLWVNEFSERGFEIVYGAQTSDGNALVRMRMLFEQFESMTTNSWGSHVAYALAFGMKVSIHGTFPEPAKENLLVDTAWRADPKAFESAFSDETKRKERAFLKDFLVPPQRAVANVPLGEWFLGAENKLTPAEMRELLPRMVTPLVAESATGVPVEELKQPPRVLFLAHGPGQINGPNIWLTRLLPELKARGFAPRVLMSMSPVRQCPIVDRLRAAGVPCDTAPLLHTEDAIRAIIGYVQAHPCDVFVPNLNVPGYFAALHLKESGVPTVGILHSDDDFYRDLTDEFVRGQNGRYLSATVAVSAYQHETLLALDHGPTKIVRAPYGAPVPDSGASYKAKPFRFVYVGRLVEEQKRISDTVRAVIALLRRQPGAEFHICGEGSARPAVEALIKEASMGHRLVLRGNLSPEDVRHTLLQSQAFVLLSDYEGVPIALMEAMAAGVVPICSRMRSGVSDLIRDGENGFIVADRTEEFIAAAERLMDDKELWTRCSVAARATIDERFSVRANAETWSKLLAELIDNAPRDRGRVEIPAQLDLPPVRTNPKGIAREDRRRPVAAVSATSREPSHPYTNPALEPDNADLYWTRSSLLRAVRQAVPVFHGTFLDLGCGEMPYREMITRAPSRVTRYIGLDVERPAGGPKPDLVWDGRTIPLDDASVDCAMATELLERCRDPLAVLKEVRRVLTPGGVFFFTAPNIWPLGEPAGDSNRFSAVALERLLADAGFSESNVQALGGWNASLAQMLGLWLKRAPLAPEARNRMAQQLWPFYQELVNTDELPANPKAGNTMATGWTVLARVQSATDANARQTAPDSVSVIGELPVVLVRSHEYNYSETFVEDHVNRLTRNLTLLYGFPFPRFVRGGRSVLPDALERRIQAAVAGGGVTADLWRDYTASLAVFLKSCGAEVSLVETGLMGAFVHEACEQAGLPYVVHFHGVDAFGQELLSQWLGSYRKFFKRAAGVVAVSKAMHKQLLKLGASNDRTLLAPYGVAVDLPALADPEKAPPRFVAVGRFVEKKAPHATLGAFALVHKQVPEARLVMIGDGPLLRPCQEWAARNGLGDAVLFAGVLSRDEVSRQMAASRAFLQHSVTAANGDSEGLPLAVLEAGAHGLPVVSTFHAGIPDAVRDGVDGFLVPEKDIKGMAVAMLRLAQDPALAARLGASFRVRVESGYSHRRSLERLLAILQAAAAGQSVRELGEKVDLSFEKNSAATAPADKPPQETGATDTGPLGAIAEDRNDHAAHLEYGKRLLKEGSIGTAYLAIGEAHRLTGGSPETTELLQQLEDRGAFGEQLVESYRRRAGWLPRRKSANRQRILVVTNLLPPQEMGGFGRTVWEFSRELAARGHTVRVLTADLPHLVRKPSAEHAAFEPNVRRVLSLYGDWKGGSVVIEPDTKRLQDVVRHNHETVLAAAKEFRPDVVMVGNLDLVGHFFVQELLDRGVPVLHRLGNEYPGYEVANSPQSPLFCLAGGSAWVNEGIRAKGYPIARFAVVPPGSPLTEYFRAFPPQRNHLRIAYAGLLMPYKGAHVLVDALAALKRAGLEFECTLAGDSTSPEFVDKLRAFAAEQGFLEKLRFPGFLAKKELAALYARSNVLVFPSLVGEVFGKTQIEAMAAGLVVISSGSGGAREIVRHGETGLIVKGGDAKDLAEKLLWVHRNSAEAGKIAAAGQADAFRFTTGASVDRIEAIFNELTAAARRKPQQRVPSHA